MAVRGAVDHEVERQGRAYDAGDAVLPETRSWDGKKTAVLRVKGGAEAYRFAPEPDLPPRPFSDFDRPDAAAEGPVAHEDQQIREVPRREVAVGREPELVGRAGDLARSTDAGGAAPGAGRRRGLGRLSLGMLCADC